MIEIKASGIIGLLFCLFSFITNVSAQGNLSLNTNGYSEKLYIQFDKPYYIAGETIWFKCYLYNQGLPSQLSDELYLQLEDERGKLIEKKIYPVRGATVTGNIILNESVPGGYYTLRVITKAIAEAEPAFIYNKNIFIYNALERQKDTLLKKKLSLQFFPESGHLIDRIKTQVAFKAIDERGNPVDLNGVIRTDSGTFIVAFKTTHDGIGKTSFTAHLPSLLFADVELNGIKYSFPLPAIEQSGVYLKITDADSGKVFEINRGKQQQDLFDTLRMVVKMNNDTVFDSPLAFGFDQVLAGLLKTRDLPSGILHFIVLNKDNIPMGERLSFLNNKEYISEPELIVLKRDSSKRGTNSFELKFKDTVQRSFSISVTDINAQEFPDKENIYSRLLLTSDLRGYVYNPGWYFEKDDAATRLGLDNLMLTQGWTRYTWKKSSNALSKVNHEENHYLIMISGLVSDQKSGQPVSNGKLVLQIVSEDSTVQSFETAVGTNGKFRQDSLLFFGNSKIYYSYSSGNGKNIPVTVLLDKSNNEALFPLFTATQYDKSEQEKTDTNFYRHILGSIPDQYFEGKFKLLNTVSLKAKLKRPGDRINEKYASQLYSSSGKLVLDNIDDPYNNSSQSVVDYILTNIRTVQYDGDAGTFVNMKNFSLQTGKHWKVEVLVDESPSSVPDVRSITMGQVALIKFYEAGFVGVSSAAAGGAVAVYLKKREDELPPVVTGTEKYLTYKGYSVTREFYQPDYSHFMAGLTTPDNRITLYWNPVVSTGPNSGNMKFSFFNNDISKRLSIIVEGFDAHGRLLHYEKAEGE